MAWLVPLAEIAAVVPGQAKMFADCDTGDVESKPLLTANNFNASPDPAK